MGHIRVLGGQEGRHDLLVIASTMRHCPAHLDVVFLSTEHVSAMNTASSFYLNFDSKRWVYLGKHLDKPGNDYL